MPPAAVVGAAFFLSGAAALVYQVAWQRILALHSGVGIYSIAMIVAAFMAGLGLGSHLGGLLSARVRGAAAAVRIFATLELAIGLFGALSCRIYYDWLYPLAPRLQGEAWRAGAFHFVALLLPTGLMGMSLPFLARGLVRDAATAGRTLGRLYGVNVLGASLGSLATPWVLIRLLGVRGAVLAAATANVVAGIGVLLATRSLRRADGDAVAAPAGQGEGDGRPREAGDLRLWLALYALSGFCALSLEILWFRVVDVAVKSTAFTFGTVLFVYLLGYGAGSLAGAQRAPRVARPLRAFLLCQCALLAYAAAVVIALAWLPVDTPGYRWLFAYWKDGNPYLPGQGLEPATLLGLYFALPLALFGPPTFLMGLSFPILQRAVQDDPRTSGFKVGLLQAANIAGCVAGSLLVGLVTLSWVGTPGTLRALLACGLVFAALGLYDGGRKLFLPAAAVLLALMATLPAGDRLWSRLHGLEDGRSLVEEDATSVDALVSRRPGAWSVWVNGHSHSHLPFGGMHTLLGAVPVLVHPAPRDVAVIGLGSGDTAWAGGCRPETEGITVFEIAAPQPRLLRRLLATEGGQADLARALDDPRLVLRVADGRNQLLTQEARYDVIEIDALWPYYAGSGNLYSLEFFRLAARRLKPGGLMCSWSPTARVRFTFARAFPHVLASRQILVGSNDPLPREPREWKGRLWRPEVQAYLGEEHAAEIGRVLSALQPLEPPSGAAPLNLDLVPRDEFDLAGAERE